MNGKVLEIKHFDHEKIVRILVDSFDITQADKFRKNSSEKNAKKKKAEEIKEYVIPFGKNLIVKEGQEIKIGDALSSGPLDIKNLFNIAPIEFIQNYIINEVGKIYAMQGAPINKKHIEVIVRQMFSRYRIKEVGDSYFGEDEVVERADFMEENIRLEKEGKVPAKAVSLVMPISKVALSTSSFLSAASFPGHRACSDKSEHPGSERLFARIERKRDYRPPYSGRHGIQKRISGGNRRRAGGTAGPKRAGGRRVKQRISALWKNQVLKYFS